MEPKDPLDEALFQRFHELEHKLAREEPYDELVAAYQAVADEFVPRYESRSQPDKALATRRSVAANLVLVAMTANRSLRECEAAFHHMVKLGFSDLNCKAHEIIAFCGYWQRRGGSSEGISEPLQSLRAELEAEHRRTGSQTWHDYRQRCDRLLARWLMTV